MIANGTDVHRSVMRNIQSRIRYIAFAISVATVAHAQVPGSTVSHLGSVTGHVTCMDTRRPARFAEVLLIPKLDWEQSDADGNASNAAKLASQAQQRIVMANGRTTLDGSYTIRNIPPGDYFVVAKLEGYIAPVLDPDRLEDVNKVLAGVPTVTVVSDRESIADLTLRRGATIAGTVGFDDGTPLVGGIVRAELLSDTDDPPGISTSATADDLGYFRVSGLSPGKYRVYADIQIAGGMNISKSGGPGSYVYSQGGKGGLGMHLSVYQPGTLRKSKAAIFEIKADEEVQGANLVVDLSGLHSVMGRAAPRISL